jgi:hypothetical protein
MSPFDHHCTPLHTCMVGWLELRCLRATSSFPPIQRLAPHTTPLLLAACGTCSRLQGIVWHDFSGCGISHEACSRCCVWCGIRIIALPPHHCRPRVRSPFSTSRLSLLASAHSSTLARSRADAAHVTLYAHTRRRRSAPARTVTMSESSGIAVSEIVCARPCRAFSQPPLMHEKIELAMLFAICPWPCLHGHGKMSVLSVWSSLCLAWSALTVRQSDVLGGSCLPHCVCILLLAVVTRRVHSHGSRVHNEECVGGTRPPTT